MKRFLILSLILPSCQPTINSKHYLNETIIATTAVSNVPSITYTLNTQEAVDFQNNRDTYLTSITPNVTYGRWNNHGLFGFGLIHHH